MEVFLMKPKNLPGNENASYKIHKGSETTSVTNGMNIYIYIMQMKNKYLQVFQISN
jgi:hypothetical protein